MTRPLYPDVSIIIPVLNESENLERCLASLPHHSNIEVIISDGGSTDNSIQIARQFPVQIVHAERGRSRQMNTAARVATGQTLLFLHADTQLPHNALESIIQSIHAGYSMGCFERVFDTDAPLLKWTSQWAGWRVRKFFLAYGDQAIFIRRNLFDILGGYRTMKRFEDLDLAIRAKKRGRWTVLSPPIITDARRFGKAPLRRVLQDTWLTLAWLAGIIDE